MLSLPAGSCKFVPATTVKCAPCVLLGKKKKQRSDKKMTMVKNTVKSCKLEPNQKILRTS